MSSAGFPLPTIADWKTVSIPSMLLDRISGRMQKIQMLPAVAQQALQMAQNQDCAIRDFVPLIEQDLKLATEMLRIANSPVYCGPKPVASLTEATMRLGLEHCKNLIFTSCFNSLIEEFSDEETSIRDALWKHSMATAVIASNLNKKLGLKFQGEEFTAGLMHDIGRILLAVALPQQFLRGDPVDFFEDDPQLLREQMYFQTTHVAAGTWFAIANRLPDCLVAAIRFHHAPAESPVHHRLVALVSAADEIANYIQRNESAEGYSGAGNRGIDLLEHSGVPNARERFELHLDAILEDSCEDAMALCGA